MRSVEDSMARGTVVLKHAGESRNKHQSVTLLEAIEEFGFDAASAAPAATRRRRVPKERIMSFRDEFGQWDPKNQRPELWNLFNARTRRARTSAPSHQQLDRTRRWTGNTSSASNLSCHRSTSPTRPVVEQRTGCCSR